MHVLLPSGNSADFRDTLQRGDVRDAKKGIKIVISADGSRMQDGSFLDELTGRLITRMMIGWTLDMPLPSSASTEELQQGILDKLEDDDYAALEKAVGPWVERLLSRERAQQFVHTQTGIAVELVNPKDADKLLALGGWTRTDDGLDPKSPPTAIGSSENQEPNGQTTTGTPSISN